MNTERKQRVITVAFYVILAVLTATIYWFAMDKANHYSVPAVVIGKDCEGDTLFKTPDGNIWAYELADEDHLQKGKEVTLNMYDNSPDGKDVRWNTILSIEVDGSTISTLYWNGEE